MNKLVQFGLVIITLMIIGVPSCTIFKGTAKVTPTSLTGFWAEQQNYWIFLENGEFRYGKLKAAVVSTYICGHYEWKNGELLIHDSLGNDLAYDAVVRGDSLSISSSSGVMHLMRKSPMPIDDHCQNGE